VAPKAKTTDSTTTVMNLLTNFGCSCAPVSDLTSFCTAIWTLSKASFLSSHSLSPSTRTRRSLRSSSSLLLAYTQFSS